MEIEFHYGVFSEPLEEQANGYGYTLGADEEKLQKLNDSMLMCWIHGLCTDSQKDSMMKKLQKQIIKALKPRK